jgi:uncharacterized phage protein (TIGR02220 family)
MPGIGYILIHRKLMDNQLWRRRPFSPGQAWVDLLLRASHQESNVWAGGKELTILPGQVLTSILSLSKAWGWSRPRVSRWIDAVKSLSQIDTPIVTPHYTLITVANWELYQNKRYNDRYNDRATTVQRPCNDRAHSKNVEECKNEEEQILSGRPDPVPYLEIVNHLNAKCGTQFKHTTKETQRFIRARWNSAFRLPDFVAVVDFKAATWRTDPKMLGYLRPETLFGTKFESYLQEARSAQNAKRDRAPVVPAAPPMVCPRCKEVYGPWMDADRTYRRDICRNCGRSESTTKEGA